MKKSLKAILVLSVCFSLARVAQGSSYCLALRGNGELAPSHWGAVSNVVEKLGLPQAQAGGSSASITMFLVDAISTNPYIKNDKVKAALLIKSLEGIVEFLSQTQQWQEFALLYSQVQALQLGSSSVIETVAAQLNSTQSLSVSQAKAWSAKNSELLLKNIKLATELGFIDPVSYQPLLGALTGLPTATGASQIEKHLLTIQFYGRELYNTLRVFGQFDAKSDDNLFFRPGIVNFDVLAKQFGRIAQFYTADNKTPAVQSLWVEFFKQCSKPSEKKVWSDLRQSHPLCAQTFYELVKTHFQSEPQKTFELRPIGASIASYPTTSVLSRTPVVRGALGPKNLPTSYEQADAALNEYALSMTSDFGKRFNISYPDTVRFGYWGRETGLAEIEKNLPGDDEKSLRFLSLGPAPWKVALGLSPAEPGLSPLKRFTTQRGERLISAGGWSDLHPVIVLKAAGCQDVIYVTRRGGESLFAQGVAKRLLGADERWLKGWEELATPSEGVDDDRTSLWSSLYNIANPKSSFQRALQGATAILCTDWNSFDVKSQMSPMISESYQSPYFVTHQKSGSQFENLIPRLNPKEQHENGYPRYVGCFPVFE
ncbi:MAG: hypothetical protein K2Q26_06400 [Bdellovibrionales bacterium]|nr:hypothetical protein [Bdellovibrionales bacterium]